MERKKITFDSFIRGVIVALVAIGILWLFKRLSSVLLPFFVAWLIAYLIYPLVTFFQHRLRLKNRAVSIVCALLSIAVVGGLAFYLLVPPMIQEFARVKDLLAEYFSSGGRGGNIPLLLSEFLHDHIDREALSQVLNSSDILTALKEALPRLWGLLAESVNILFSFFTVFMVLLYVVFILWDYESIASGWVHLVPPRYRPLVVGVFNDIKDGMNRYFRGQALVASIVGILHCIGFLIIGLPMAIPLGLLVGLLNMIPYMQILSYIPAALLCIIGAADTGSNFWLLAVCTLAVYLTVQVIQDGFLVPRIMGNATGLNPAIILLSLSIWGSLLGVIGMIIALPLTSLLLSYYRHYIIMPDEEKENGPANSKE